MPRGNSRAFTKDDINENSENMCYINCTPGEVKQTKIYSMVGCSRHIEVPHKNTHKTISSIPGIGI